MRTARAMLEPIGPRIEDGICKIADKQVPMRDLIPNPMPPVGTVLSPVSHIVRIDQ